MITILLYLAAVVCANLTISLLGPTSSIVTAFVLIGATMTLRDRIHDDVGPRAMFWLIPLGAAISAVFGSTRIALASVAAFAASETVDTLGYHALRRHAWLKRSNGSNVAAAAVDSLVFPLLAFGGLLWTVIVGQFIAKTLGGALWAWVLSRRRSLAVAAALVCFAVLPMHAQATQAAAPPHIVLQAQTGTMHYPWMGYDHPVGNAGLNAIVFFPRGFSLLTVVSHDMRSGAGWVGVFALQYRLWSW